MSGTRPETRALGLGGKVCVGVAVEARGLGGTSVLIVVGVAIDTMRQIESQLSMRAYKGFLR